MNSKHERGISAVEVILVLAVIGLIGAVGYMFYANQIQKPADSSQQADDTPVAPEINSTEDLDKANETLDQTDPESSNSQDASELDSETSDL